MKKTIILLLGLLFILVPSISQASTILDEQQIQGVHIDKNLKEDPNVNLNYLDTLPSRLYTIIDSEGNYYFCLQEHRYYPDGDGEDYELNLSDEPDGSVVWLIEHFYSDFDGNKSSLTSYVNENFETKYSATQIAIWYFTNPSSFNTPEKMKVINENQIIKDLIDTAETHKDDSIKNYEELLKELDNQTLTLSEIVPVGETDDYYAFQAYVEKNLTEDFKLTNEHVAIELLTNGNQAGTDITDEAIIEIVDDNRIDFKIPKDIINDNKHNGTLLLRVGADIETKTRNYLMFSPISANVQNIGTCNTLKKSLVDFRVISMDDLTGVTVIKKWVDNNNRDGFQPDNIEVQLYADEKPIGNPGKLNAGNNWRYVWNALPKHDENGKDIVYSVKEVGNIPHYKSIVTKKNDHYFVIANIHIPKLINISGEKKWVEPIGQNDIRPDKVTIHLLANGVKIDSVDVDESTGWKYSFNNLFKYENQKEIIYTVEEDPVPGYQSEVNGYDVTNTYNLTSLTVTKSWKDNENQDGIRPENIEVQLYADGEAHGNPETLSESNEWTHTWQGLDKKVNGTDIVYTVKEVSEVPGYKSIVGDTDFDSNTGNSSVSITNSHTPELTEIKGSKTWNDKENQDGIRPASITVNLLANGKKVDEKIVSKDDNWSYLFDDLPKYQDGKEIIYTVTENNVPDYSVEIDGYDITNNYTPGMTSLTVTKSWEDNQNQDGIQPENIEVQLYADGKAHGKPEILSESNKWTHTWQELDKKASGKDIVYTVKEVSKVPGYESIVGDADNGNVVITNSHTPELTEVKGSKTWNDNENQDGIRPDSITVNLLADGKKVDEKIVSKDDNWSYLFDNLPKYQNGEEIIYTVTENNVPDYSIEIDGYDITNNYTPGITSLTVTKSWEDNQNQDGIQPENIEVQLYADGKAHGKPEILSESNKWTHTWQELDEKASGKDILYTVKEVSEVPGYESIVGDADNGNVVITNSHTPELTEVKGSKIWNDKENQDGIRPDSITVNLLANGKKVDEKIVSKNDNWSYLFDDLPKYQNGEEIIYTVTENKVPDYSVEINGYDITNNYTPGITSLTVTKSWEDNQNQEGIRPKNIEVQLYADGKAHGKPVTLSENNKWTHTWQGLDEKANGKDIVYTVKEVNIPNGYKATIEIKNGNVTITNSRKVVPTTPSPNSPGNSNSSFPKTGEVRATNSSIIGLVVLCLFFLLKTIYYKKNKQ